MLKCPNCNNQLNKVNKQYICINNHSFDVSKENYVNLLLANMTSKNPGDNKEMIQARTKFLNKDYFKLLIETINSNYSQYLNGKIILDCGCGEGYFTDIIKHNFPTSTIYGIDISKSAISKAAKQNKEIIYCVASGAKLPFFDKSVDIIINIFAPFFENEFSRTISDNGYIIKVIPGENHLIELKEILYDNPYLNDEQIQISNFIEIDKTRLEYQTLINQDDLINLFKMTPYYYKTKGTKQNYLNYITKINITFSFIIILYEKNRAKHG